MQNAGPAPSPIGQLPPNEGMPGGPMAPNFFPVSTPFDNVLDVFISKPVEPFVLDLFHHNF